MVPDIEGVVMVQLSEWINWKGYIARFAGSLWCAALLCFERMQTVHGFVGS